MNKTNNTLEAMLKQYENNSNSTYTTQTEKFDLSNYFSTHLPDKEKSTTKTIIMLHDTYFWMAVPFVLFICALRIIGYYVDEPEKN